MPSKYKYSRYSNLSSRSIPSPKSQKTAKRAVVYLAAALFIGLGLYLGINNKVAAHEARVAKIAYEQNLQKALPAKIGAIINQNSPVTFSVSLVNLDDNSTKSFGYSAPMEAASTTKLLTAILFLHEVEIGHASLADQFGDSSAYSQLKQLINQSDDNAWQLFNDKLGNDSLQAYADSIGLSSYSVADNSISSTDMASLLAKLYQKKLLSSSHTKLLLSFMQDTNYEDFITPAVPRGDTIYHKVGLLDDNVNDASIISDGSRSFVLVIFTDGGGTYDWPSRATAIQAIAKDTIPAYLD